MMGRESSIDQLKPEDRQMLDRWLMDKGFCGYEEIATKLAELVTQSVNLVFIVTGKT
jgi:hypothetical protein